MTFGISLYESGPDFFFVNVKLRSSATVVSSGERGVQSPEADHSEGGLCYGDYSEHLAAKPDRRMTHTGGAYTTRCHTHMTTLSGESS